MTDEVRAAELAGRFVRWCIERQEYGAHRVTLTVWLSHNAPGTSEALADLTWEKTAAAWRMGPRR